jgi:aspartyl-tRNA(Asn)/glutamyl-tRNA(Gln) amidotransferase subunit A
MPEHHRPVWSLTARELAALFAAGVTDPVAVMEDCFARIDAVNPVLNAVVTEDREGARRAAEASAKRWRAGSAIGALDGVPLTIKDNLFVGGLRATWGSLLFADHVASHDDLAVARLRSAGAVILGKTNTPELALAGYTSNRLFGATGNPWAPSLSPGGSSGGAAACVMSGVGPLALATDAGGSTRRPASYVGCVGLKPSVGRVPRRYGFPLLTADLQSIGLMARTVADARLFFDCIAAPRAMPSPRSRLRIGTLCQIGDAPVEPEIEAAWTRTCAALASKGHDVEPIAAFFDPEECGEIFLGLAAVGIARVVTLVSGWQNKVTPQIANLVEQGSRTAATDYVALVDRLARIRWEAADLFKKVDVVVTPTAAGPLWPKGEAFPAQIAGRRAAPRASAIYATFGNVAGLAAISLPAGLSSQGHPIGIQIMGPIDSEELILDLAEVFEAAHPWPTLAPLCSGSPDTV